jgi:hypothetical protein
MRLNVHVMCKCIGNRIDLIVNGPLIYIGVVIHAHIGLHGVYFWFILIS